MRPPANHQIIGHKRPAWGACPPWAAFSPTATIKKRWPQSSLNVGAF